MKKLFFIPLAVLAAVAFASGPGSAPATAATTCQAEFDVLRADTETVAITAGKVEKERTGLLKLVQDAEALTAVGKTSDAVKKLVDFEVKIDQLEAAGRIDAADATRLRAEAEAAIGCLQPSSA